VKKRGSINTHGERPATRFPSKGRKKDRWGGGGKTSPKFRKEKKFGGDREKGKKKYKPPKKKKRKRSGVYQFSPRKKTAAFTLTAQGGEVWRLGHYFKNGQRRGRGSIPIDHSEFFDPSEIACKRG